MARGATGTKTAQSGPMTGRKVLNESGTKEPQDVDRHVGSRVRMQRMAIGMSQGKLGDACGITFQQIQKYEKGMNRMGASRLHQIAGILQVPTGDPLRGRTGSRQCEPATSRRRRDISCGV